MMKLVSGVLAIALTVTASGAAPSEPASYWAGAWGYAPAAPDPDNKPLPPGTYKYRARLSQQGSAVMLTFSNAEGTDAVEIARATIALAAPGTGLDEVAGTGHALTFGGSGGAYLPTGRSVVSDPASFPAAVGRDVVVSVTFSTPTLPGRTNLATPMEFEGKPIQARSYLSLIAVERPDPGCTVVVFGDSITDGFGIKSPEVRGWPGRLAERLAARAPAARCGVVNMGVSGNRLLQNGRGVAALERFWRDVASVPGVTHLVVLEGINDIGNAKPGDRPAATVDGLIGAYREIVRRAHSLGIKVIGGTMTPALGTWNMDEQKDKLRIAVNERIRNGGIFDAVVDFDAKTRDPASPSRLLAPYDSGDHIHPSDKGYWAMGDAVDLSLIGPRPR